MFNRKTQERKNDLNVMYIRKMKVPNVTKKGRN